MIDEPLERADRLNGNRVSMMLADHFRRMPRWHLSVLMLAVAGMVVGTLGVARRAVLVSPAAQQHASKPGRSTDGASVHEGFVNDTDRDKHEGSTGRTTLTTAAPTDNTPWYLSPRFLRIGGSTVGGFVIGWLMRTFVKTVSLVLAAIAALLGTASYFRWFNVDFSTAHQQFATGSAWLTSQVSLLKASALAHLPSHTGAALGAYIGFKRR